MSLLAVGLSHSNAPMSLLEKVALDEATARSLARRLLNSDHIGETSVLATCNRLEVYARVNAFHGAVTDIGTDLSRVTGVDLSELTDNMYVLYGDKVVEHVFHVAAGLKSMAVGEPQILGQVRTMLNTAQDDGTAGSQLTSLLQRALRAAKRAHTQTSLDAAGPSLVTVSLEHLDDVFDGPTDTLRAVVVGAGAMSSLAATTLRRRDIGHLVIANRTPERAERLARSLGAHAMSLSSPHFVDELAQADVIVTCTGAIGYVLDEPLIRHTLERRGQGVNGPQLMIDLALPRDIDPKIAELPGVTVIGLSELGEELSSRPGGRIVEQASALVDGEVQEYLSEIQNTEVGPTVAALRQQAYLVAEAELDRLRSKLGPGTDPQTIAEVSQAMHRLVGKILHNPTVRVKSMGDNGASYVTALQELFDLDVTPSDALETEVARVIGREKTA